MKIVIIGGFLGSGKTSVILKAAHYLADGGTKKVAILENEIGEIGVDDRVLKGTGFGVRGLFAGCVCCTLAGELPEVVAELEKTEKPDLLIIETTGVAFPYSVRETLERVGRTAWITCVTDAKRWGKLYKPMEHLFRFQLKDADVVLINKADLATEESLRETEEAVRALNSEAEIFRTNANAEIDEAVLRKVIGETDGE